MDFKHTCPCPKCGKVGKLGKAEFLDAVQLKESMSRTKLHEFYRTNKPIRNLIIAITIISPFLGLLLSGVIGLMIGLLIGIVSYFLSPYAVVKVKEIEHWKVE